MVPVLAQDTTIMTDIKEHVKYVAQKMMWSGYLPKTDTGPIKHLVQVCHGSPGAIPMLSVAMEIFPDLTNVLTECAQKAGEITWR